MTMKTINIRGWQGNAFSLMGYAKDFGKQLGFDDVKINQITDEMISDDYQHLLSVFENNFSDVVTLVDGKVKEALEDD